jgi:hypothetical protein
VTAVPQTEPPPKPLHQITAVYGYLQNYGRILGKKAVRSLAPLDVRGRDLLPDFDDPDAGTIRLPERVAASGT